ncbi:hypothetical protein CFIMG_006383RAa [Ceratocystis fimbriata CBS 114723]|uniref:Uncharacterized protein n=1 Tax=Ceratocystis fimbriata CBS 114723 TaxID=1035309 RepID=A0A2C5WUL1_9PEZI|nr:hypothetical protein CFIMG_006383RAa [Ceratocystis fimbriata CBS 114723]
MSLRAYNTKLDGDLGRDTLTRRGTSANLNPIVTTSTTALPATSNVGNSMLPITEPPLVCPSSQMSPRPAAGSLPLKGILKNSPTQQQASTCMSPIDSLCTTNKNKRSTFPSLASPNLGGVDSGPSSAMVIAYRGGKTDSAMGDACASCPRNYTQVIEEELENTQLPELKPRYSELTQMPLDFEGAHGLDADLSHPQGYQQNIHAFEYTADQRAAQEASLHKYKLAYDLDVLSHESDATTSGWNMTRHFVAAASQKFAMAEEEMWNRINTSLGEKAD